MITKSFIFLVIMQMLRIIYSERHFTNYKLVEPQKLKRWSFPLEGEMHPENSRDPAPSRSRVGIGQDRDSVYNFGSCRDFGIRRDFGILRDFSGFLRIFRVFYYFLAHFLALSAYFSHFLAHFLIL